MQKKNIFLTFLDILTVLLTVLFVVLRLYRRKNAAYTALAARAIEWSRQTESSIELPVLEFSNNGSNSENNAVACEIEDPIDKEDRRIMSLLEQEMTNKQIYRDANLSVESLARKLGLHRNALSKANNRVTGDNYKQYINSYRIKEAVRIILQSGDEIRYIDELYEQVGFTNRSSFYRAFKQFTGLSPAEFRKNATSAVLN